MTTQTLNLSHPNIIALTINGSIFLMTASKELSPSMKDEIEFIVRFAFDEEESSLLEISDLDSVDDLREFSEYNIASLLAAKIEQDFDVTISFLPIELEQSLEY